ncbi:uncharacterized protein LOC117181233 [Belonocnema kinseyi]|uniref:uncharacterized protein LOC117181233 n=1 Tax=Belonocnema kinseyi TaxID=2817044 RepID=UPI00143D5ED8|nr:uncharacterized protein LOC117181233 [Belonocnema kinseyi]
MRNYVRKTNVKSWKECSMIEALKGVLEKKLSFTKASETYPIPASILKTRWKRMLEAGGLDQVKFLQLGKYRPTLSEDPEKELVEHIRIMDSKFFGLTRNKLRRVLFKFAEELGIPHNFSKTIGIAGRDWYQKFMKRHPEISLRTPENTSFARAAGFNKFVTNKFFDLLDGLMTEFEFPPHNIWNVDETGTSVVPKKQPKVISLKGKHQVGMISSAERGITVTAAICCNTAGQFLPC